MSLVYAMPDSTLSHMVYYPGKIVASLQAWFFELANDTAKLNGLDTVDGSRKIVQSSTDVVAVSQMTEELNTLVVRIAQDLQPDIATSFTRWRSKIESEFVL
jgi:hypothetical protein